MRVWDIFIRFFHWSLASCFLISFFSHNSNYEQHVYCGYLIIFLIIARIIWGFTGSKYALFSSFSYNLKNTMYYTKSLFFQKPPRYTGHTPLGAAMIFTLLLSISLVCLSGIALDAAENRDGILANTNLFLYTDVVRDIHRISTYFVLGLVAIHVIAVLYMSKLHKENLLVSMITGNKDPRSGDIS